MVTYLQWPLQGQHLSPQCWGGVGRLAWFFVSTDKGPLSAMGVSLPPTLLSRDIWPGTGEATRNKTAVGQTTQG